MTKDNDDEVISIERLRAIAEKPWEIDEVNELERLRAALPEGPWTEAAVSEILGECGLWEDSGRIGCCLLDAALFLVRLTTKLNAREFTAVEFYSAAVKVETERGEEIRKAVDQAEHLRRIGYAKCPACDDGRLVTNGGQEIADVRMGAVHCDRCDHVERYLR